LPDRLRKTKKPLSRDKGFEALDLNTRLLGQESEKLTSTSGIILEKGNKLFIYAIRIASVH
jgi:hypothetical protein